VINGATLGLGAPVASTAEDVTSVGLSFAAILAPVLVLLLLVALAVAWWRVRRRRAARAAAGVAADDAPPRLVG
jgi:hypothetical protein